MSPLLALYLEIMIAAAIVAVTAVAWDRWYIRKQLIKEFVKQLWIEQRLREWDDK